MRFIIVGLLGFALCGSVASAQGSADPAFEGLVRVMPDLAKSPSALDAADVVRQNLKYSDLCPHANTTAIRNVPASQADAVYAEYGMVRFKGACAAPDPVTKKNPGGCEVDHICSLELGCNNNIKNTWVQPYAGVCWSAHVKDAYEDWLHTHFLCGTAKEGNIAAKQASFAANLATAQKEIATNWIAGYRSHPTLPLPACAK